MKKIVMLAAVGILSICSVMAENAVPSLDELKKNVSEAENAFKASNSKYNAFLNKNLSQECKDARKVVNDANNAALAQRIKMLQADEKYAQAAEKYATAREEALKTKTKEAKAAEAAAARDFNNAWKESKKAASPEYKAFDQAIREAGKAQGKADSDFRAANAEAAKLWNARTEDSKKLTEAKNAYGAAAKKAKTK